jgi:hypothetical protein
MTIKSRKIITLTCDGWGCQSKFRLEAPESEGLTKSYILAAAKDHGWTIKKSNHTCPFCSGSPSDALGGFGD